MRLTRNYFNVPADELPVVLRKDIDVIYDEMVEKLTKQKEKISWEYEEELFGNVVLHKKVTIIAEMVNSSMLQFIPLETQVDYVTKIMYFLKDRVAQSPYPRNAKFMSKLISSPPLHLPNGWVFSPTDSLLRLFDKFNYDVNPDYVYALGRQLYKTDYKKARTQYSYLSIASAVGSYSNLLVQRYMRHYVLDVWLSDEVLEEQFEKFYAQFKQPPSLFFWKFDMKSFLRYVHDLKSSLGSDLFLLTESVMGQRPYSNSSCNELDVWICITNGWEQQLRDAYLFAELIEEQRALLSLAYYLENILKADPDGLDRGRSEQYVMHRALVLQLLEKYNQDIDNIHKTLRNIASKSPFG